MSQSGYENVFAVFREDPVSIGEPIVLDAVEETENLGI
jgi:hypothetical protein